jgi:hypothetical protein
MHIFTKKWVGLLLGDFFMNESVHPGEDVRRVIVESGLHA